MLVAEGGVKWRGRRFERGGEKCHACDLLKHHRVVHGLCERGPPGERCVTPYERAGYLQGPAIGDRLDQYRAGVALVALVDLLLRQCAGDRDRSEERRV